MGQPSKCRYGVEFKYKGKWKLAAGSYATRKKAQKEAQEYKEGFAGLKPVPARTVHILEERKTIPSWHPMIASVTQIISRKVPASRCKRK